MKSEFSFPYEFIYFDMPKRKFIPKNSNLKLGFGLGFGLYLWRGQNYFTVIISQIL